MKLVFSRPTKEDVIPLHNFFDKVIQHTFEANGLGDLETFIQEEKISKRSALRQDFDTFGEKTTFLIAKINGSIVGTIDICGPNEILKKNVPELCHLPEVGTIFVHPDYQGQGISKQLIANIEGVLISKGIQQYILDSGYPIAQKIWQKVFGDPYKVLKDYWDDGGHHSIWLVDIASDKL